MTSGDVVAQDGSRLRLQGQWSIRELTLELDLLDTSSCGCVCDACQDCDGGGVSELQLYREQVVELTEQLTAWLERGR